MTTTLTEILQKLQDIQDILNLKVQNITIAPNQIVISEGLSDIDKRLGVIQAGEFRTGNGKLPGDGFTGVRIGYPAFVYGTETWNIAGVNNDEIQFGLRASDGVAVAGNGNITINSDGIVIVRDSPATGSAIQFYDPTGVTREYIIYADSFGLQVVSDIASKSLTFFVTLTNASQPYLKWYEHPSVANVALLEINATATATTIQIGAGDISLSANRSGTSNNFNESGLDVDFRVESDTNQYALFLDAALERIEMFGGDLAIFDNGSEHRLEIGADHYFPTRNSDNPNGFWNEANQDMDFTFRGVTDDTVLKIDAGTDTVLYKGVTIRENVSANRTYYVRTDGSDSNTGLANTSGAAFLTIQKAYDTILTLDLRGYEATIQIADGTYTGRLNITVPPHGGNVTINGNASTPANVVLSVTSNDAITMDAAFTLTIQNFKITTTTGGNCVTCTDGKVVVGVGMNFGACAAEHLRAMQAGIIKNVSNNYTISGAATRHMSAILGGSFEYAFSTITVSGTPAITEFVLATLTGTVSAFSITFSGSATGVRYNANMNGAIQTYGGGANYFPGNSAGTTATGGQYA